jgi:hypothetical protein
MANDALRAYRADIAAGKDALLIPDSWELCDALNKQIHADRVAQDAETVTGARDHQIGVGDIVVTRENDARINVWAARDHRGRPDTNKPAPQVRNGQRWVVEAIDTRDHRPRIAARRLGDNAVTVLGGDYLRGHVQHGYAVTLQSAQGVTADTSYPIVRATTDRNTLYVGLTRGRDFNRAYVYERIAGEGDHEHADPTPGIHQTRRGDSHQAVTLVRAITRRDNRPRTVHQVAAQTDPHHLPDRIARAVSQQARARTQRVAAQRIWIDHNATDQAQQDRWIREYVDNARDRDSGHDLGL